jgi:4a-hydroxytetrahydrobiopterin dehydratase
MAEQISRRRFHEWDWRVIRDAASAHFHTGSFAAGVALVDEIGRLADAASHHPDVDLRADGVTVRLFANREGEYSERDVSLAEQISSAAKELGAAVDPSALQTIQIAIDALVIPEVMPFWRAVLGYDQVGDEDVQDPRMVSPPFWFQQMDAPRPQRNRIHIDLYVPHDQAEARVAAAIAAGGHIVNDEHAPGWWTLADAEGNEVDIAPWPDGD